MLGLLELFFINQVVPNILSDCVCIAGKAGVKKVFRINSKQKSWELMRAEIACLNDNLIINEMLLKQLLGETKKLTMYTEALVKN